MNRPLQPNGMYIYSRVLNSITNHFASVNTLPVTNDEEAAPYAYCYLVELIEQ